MKGIPKSKVEDELRPEYDMAQLLKGGVRGKYSKRSRSDTNLVLLSPDVHRAFPSEKAVNDTLWLVMKLTRIPGIRSGGAAKD